jgi:hypothetical protein
MRSKQLLLDKYDSDKITNRYLEEYDPIFEPWVQKNIKLLELGIYKGGSLLLWRDYFQTGTIVGIDINIPTGLEQEERIHLFKGSQTDTRFLSEVAMKMAPDGFDIIIDDASHIGEFTKSSFWHLFDNHLKPGGLYVIEDWGTGYHPNFPDGKGFKNKSSFLSKLRSHLVCRFNFLIRVPFIIKIPFETHRYGMVGFIKQLVDELGVVGYIRGIHKFSNMVVTRNMVVVSKAVNKEDA